MKFVLGTVIGILGISSLTGCGAEAAGGGEAEVIGVQSEALLVTSAALSRGTRHDFNGDGKEDVIFFDNDLGSYQLLGTAPGGWTINASTWVRQDLKPTNASYTVGDFNKDGKSDLLILTASGTSEHTGVAGGGFNANVWSTSAFKRDPNTGPLADFTVGDFNGDGWTDFIATTANGSYLYTGKGSGGTSGGFNANVWSSTANAFKRGNVIITPGNFNSDATTDFIASTSSGSFLYTGTAGTGASGGFTANVWSDTTLKFATHPNVVRLVAGNFNGTGPDDFIVQKPTVVGGPPGGAFLYTAKAFPAVGFNANQWTQASYDITGSLLTVGDYNGDGYSDFLFRDGTKLFVRYGKSTAPYIGPEVWVDTRFPNFYDASLIRGDFTGDGRDDFVVQTRPTTGNGSFERSGKPAPANGFNPDVWTDPGMFEDSLEY